MKTNIFSRIKYWILASFVRKMMAKHHPFVIGIIGSDVERKLTKKAIFCVLADKFGEDVFENTDLLGSEQGAYLAILKYQSDCFWPFLLINGFFRTFMRSYPKFLVLEFGAGNRGYLRQFATVTKLDILVVANNTASGIGSVQVLTDIMKPEGKILFNSNSELLSQIEKKSVTTVSITDRNADFFATNFTPAKDGTIYRILTRGQNIAIKSKTAQESDLISQLFAFAVGYQFNIQSLKIKKSLEKISG